MNNCKDKIMNETASCMMMTPLSAVAPPHCFKFFGVSSFRIHVVPILETIYEEEEEDDDDETYYCEESVETACSSSSTTSSSFLASSVLVQLPTCCLGSLSLPSFSRNCQCA